MKKRLILAYILKEISYPFFLVLFILTFVLLMGKILQLMDLMINKGIGFFTIAQLIAYLMPAFLTITIPISLLIAILIGLGRLSRDNEILIMKSSGISLYQLIPPIAVASVSAFFITLVMEVLFVPYGNVATRNLLFDMAKQTAGIGIKEKVFTDTFKGLIIYADRIPAHGKFMEGVFISDNRLGTEPTTIIAKRGYLISSHTSPMVTLRLETGSTHTVGSDMKTYKKMDFGSYDISLNLSQTTTGPGKSRVKDTKELSPGELIQRIREPGTRTVNRRELIIELNKKITIPLSCIIFAILALPLGIVRHRTAKSRGFVVGLGVVLIYYTFQLWGEALGETGRLSPILGTWAPIIIFGLAGIYLLVMAATEQPLIGSETIRGLALKVRRCSP